MTGDWEFGTALSLFFVHDHFFLLNSALNQLNEPPRFNV